jgi:uncharacterized membrane-anchored protein
MKNLFDYCYYRISKAYRFWDEKDYWLGGRSVLFTCFSSHFLCLLAFVFSLFGKKFNSTIIILIVVCFFVLSLFFYHKRKYVELEKQYKNEKHSKLKGWLVFLYVIGSLVLFFVAINVFDV